MGAWATFQLVGLALVRCAHTARVRSPRERSISNYSHCPAYYDAPWETRKGQSKSTHHKDPLYWYIPEMIIPHFKARPRKFQGDNITSFIYNRLHNSQCNLQEPSLSSLRLDSFEHILRARATEARKRIMFDGQLGVPSPDSPTYFILTTPKRLCLAGRVFGQLESGGASGRVVIVHGKTVGVDKCLQSAHRKSRRFCTKRNVNIASLNEYLYPLIYDPKTGSDINILLEDDAALCATPDLLVDQARRAPIMWLGYRHRINCGAHLLGIWRNATPFLAAIIQNFLSTLLDVYYLRGCLNPVRSPWSLGSTFSHPTVQRDTEIPYEEAERGHTEKCNFAHGHSRWSERSKIRRIN